MTDCEFLTYFLIGGFLGIPLGLWITTIEWWRIKWPWNRKKRERQAKLYAERMWRMIRNSRIGAYHDDKEP